MVWVIGCKGMLGSEICRQLLLKKIDFAATGKEVDVRDYNALQEYAESKDIKWIINCAAYTAVDKAETDEKASVELNEIGPGNIAKIAQKINARIVHISTDYVFDGSQKLSIKEDVLVSPVSVYGRTKAAGEIAVIKNCLYHYIFRTAWLYGWNGKNFVYSIIKTMNSHDSIKVVNDQIGSPTFAANLADIILTIIERDLDGKIECPAVPYGIYNYTDSGEISWWDFANEIKKQGIESGLVTNKDCIIKACNTQEYAVVAPRPAYSVLSKDKVQKSLKIEIPDWKEALKEFLNSDLFDKNRIL